MSTNFYLVKPVPEEDKHILIDLAQKGDIDTMSGVLATIREETIIHLGKRSCGWQFVWNSNWGKYYDFTKSGIQKFLEEEIKRGAVIRDEYGNEMDIQGFFEVEIGKSLKSGINNYHDNLAKYGGMENRHDHLTGEQLGLVHKYKINYFGEFINDGLLFLVGEFC